MDDQAGLLRLAAGPWQALVAPDFGMNTVSLRFAGQPVLREPGSLAQLAREGCVYGIPLLLPPNRTADGRFCFEGVRYTLPINEPACGNHLHGLLHAQPFAVRRHSQTAVCAEYNNTGAVFPFAFCLRAEYRLSAKGYRQRFTLRNTGRRDMPLTFGLHTAFAQQPAFRVPVGQCWAVNERFLPTGRLLPLTPAQRQYRRGAATQGQPVRGFFTSAGRTAQIGDTLYRVSAAFDQWVLWNGDGAGGFCCIEPLQGAVNALNTGVGLLRLAPGCEQVYETRIFRAGPYSVRQ